MLALTSLTSDSGLKISINVVQSCHTEDQHTKNTVYDHEEFTWAHIIQYLYINSSEMCKKENHHPPLFFKKRTRAGWLAMFSPFLFADFLFPLFYHQICEIYLLSFIVFYTFFMNQSAWPNKGVYLCLFPIPHFLSSVFFP